ncbi:hypothetical protein G3N59_25595 [Paraburkholderia sp. Ac-20340]|uniref:hypothetical protein n=1 Tax=Paraburkholderia sp. Ac-20340 TaxID=2703888 RepID=UPI00197F559D|nr:hypothetical protein [Paraburkholderia sp. Ac-20340]MBN3856758.1 hypothetical protein [Paraburkholderia sp. Ac-20340]
MCTTIEDRIILLLDERTRLGQTDGARGRGRLRRVVDSLTEFIQVPEPGRGYFERLTEYTGISTQRWRKVFHRRQRPTPDMIEALARLFPQYAFWIATRITDSSNGHVAPANAQTFPERPYVEADAANQYFRRSIVLFRRLFEEAEVELKDDQARMRAATRMPPVARWHDGPLVDAAYRVAQSDEYAQLREIWFSREDARSANLRRIWSAAREGRPWNRGRRRAQDSDSGKDPRAAHQHLRDLYFAPRTRQPTRFALSVLNTSPAALTDEQVIRLRSWIERMQGEDLFVFLAYLEHHGIARERIFPLKPARVRYAWLGMEDAEIGRFMAYLKGVRLTTSRTCTGRRIAQQSGA